MAASRAGNSADAANSLICELRSCSRSVNNLGAHRGGVMAVGCIAMLGFEHGDHVWVGHDDEVMTEIGKLVKRDAKLDEP